ncbi:MAG: tRNA(Met) cytidine acetyltransferase [Gammaproteobacteria bacterium]|nr:tRNA(Met) cytidine acetyltransferase [Gammaproteobacteria bacterium]
MHLLTRKIIVLKNVISLNDSLQDIIDNYEVEFDELTVIDTTRDFNQNKWLGQELSHTIIYINPKTRVNNILSVTGCVKGGSILIFAFENGVYSSFFEKFFIPKIMSLSNSVEKISLSDSLYLNKKSLIDLVQYKISKSKILHIIGPRGTGKSSLIGAYVETLFNKKPPYPHVVLVSPSKKSSENTMKQITDVSRETFVYIQPHLLTEKQLEQADVVMVDEAASLPHELIEKVRKYAKNKVIFSTTIDGYESTGQSYRLENLMRSGESEIRLDAPKRFSQHDALHNCIQQLCHPTKSVNNFHIDNGVYNISEFDMPYDEILITVFSLLQDAHYKTTPNDFASLYDTKGILMLCVHDKAAVGALHAISECLEPIDRNLVQAIFYGKRRVKNAMTQQQIINAYGVEEIANKKILRVSRIAIEEEHRRKRFGENLIKELEQKAIKLNYDFLSTSFSFQPKTYAFWESQGFVPVLVGINKNKWHNSYSIVMLKPLEFENSKNTELLKNINKLFDCHVSFYKGTYIELFFLIKNRTRESYFLNEELKLIVPNIEQELDSVLNHHRDINWLLPRLTDIKDKIRPEYTEINQKIKNGSLLNKVEKKKLIEILRGISH